MTTSDVSRARAAVLTVFLLNGLVFAAWVSRIPATRDRLHLEPAEVGLVLLAVSLGAVLALPSTGAVVQRVGAATTVRAGAVVCTLGLALAGLADHVPLLVVGLFLMGFGSGSWDVAMNVEGAEVERRLDRHVMPHFHASWSVGSVVGSLVGALLVYLHVATAVHLVVVAVLVLVLAQVGCTWFLPAGAAHEQEAAPRESALSAWREPRVLAIGLLVLTFAFTEGTANDWLSLAVIDGFDVRPALGVLTFGFFVTAMTVGRVAGTKLLDRYGTVRVLRATALAALIGLLLVVLGPNLPVAMVGAVIWGLGASLGFPVGMSAAADEPARAAVRVSVVASIGYTAFLAGPPAVGFLAQHVGVRESLWLVLAVLVLALFLAPATAPRGDAAGAPRRQPKAVGAPGDHEERQ
ncbi:MAG TPA: MFS transporter [Angustibacter sp.]|nr:MFS transporter [Angustibacter sp.]